MFSKDIVKINDFVTLHILKIESLTPDLKKLIDDLILNIYSKGADTDISLVKVRILKYLKSKKGSTHEIGSTAEFFVHLYLNYSNFQQECLYENLEENSSPKGFDGYYSKDSEEWIMESKSGGILTKDITHHSKIQEAFKNLSEKISGKDNKNNPWRNAWRHVIAARSDKSIECQIKEISDKYDKGQYTDIKEYNIIPSSTIFLDGKTVVIDGVENNDFIKIKIKEWADKKEYKRMEIICITKKTKDIFEEYLNK
ncbi:MAG: hypothetical protein U9O20_04505 [Patescibacteria group bacterium]|nr:hypothetical protein [Patescibacteria group bacterium]